VPIRAERIEAKVAWFHGDSDEVSGSPKILADLRGDGEVISRKTVAKTMRKLHLVGVCPKRWKTTTLTNHVDAYPVDAAKRDWDKGELNRVWVGDIERHEALLNRAVMKGHRLRLVAASRKKLRAARSLG
jgi:putative transposase